MIKNFAGLIMLIISGIAFTMCDKDTDHPKRYVRDDTYTGQIRLFTNSGEINDPEIIDRFISGTKSYFRAGENELDDEWQVGIEILTGTAARLVFAPDSSIDFNLVRENGVLYFEFRDTLIRNGTFGDEQLKYKPLFVLESPSFPGIHTVYVPCIYAIEYNGEIHIPVVSYVERIYDSNGEFLYSQGIGNNNNVFDTTYLEKMQNGSFIDSIAFQDNVIVFREE